MIYVLSIVLGLGFIGSILIVAACMRSSQLSELERQRGMDS